MRLSAICLAVSFSLYSPIAGNAADGDPNAYRLSDRNTEAPFCYLPGARRTWPISQGQRSPADRFQLAVRQADQVVAQGAEVNVRGLTISISPRGRLVVDSANRTDDVSLQLDVQHESSGGQKKRQTLDIRSAPPSRPLTYLADFGDDIIRIFGYGTNQYRAIEKNGFDQYFRRLQAHGITRLIVWQSPFPYIVDPQNYSTEDWRRYRRQAEAILESEELRAGIAGRSGYAAWAWVKQLMALRLMPGLGEMISSSAREHGIRLTASFRPFEAALTKYYVVPAFDEQGRFLWNFQPLCSPAVNYHPHKIGFAHYREILRGMDQSAKGDVAAVELQGVEGAAELASQSQQGGALLDLVASPFPPLASDSLVLMRQPNGRFKLVFWRAVRDKCLSHLKRIQGARLQARGDTLRIAEIAIPPGCPYLWISRSSESQAQVTVSAIRPAVLWAKAGNRLGGGKRLLRL